MANQRMRMPTDKQLVKLRKEAMKKIGAGKIKYHGAAHKILLFSKFKKKAFAWDDWVNFHADNYAVRRSSGEAFLHLVVSDYLYHRVINGQDYFQITPRGEHKLYEVAEERQRRDSKEVSRRNRLSYLAGIGKDK
jgi:6-phosphogluconolactonase/glucosamine-6-phosphate isomerase/deaminase